MSSVTSSAGARTETTTSPATKRPLNGEDNDFSSPNKRVKTPGSLVLSGIGNVEPDVMVPKDNFCPAALTSSASDQLSSLQSLLDFSSASLEDASSISSRFDAIADKLLNDFYLTVQRITGSSGDKRSDDSVKSVTGCGEGAMIMHHLQILELEFYLVKEGSHEDPFTHAAEEQRFCGKW
jgi:hypothetical protein